MTLRQRVLHNTLRANVNDVAIAVERLARAPVGFVIEWRVPQLYVPGAIFRGPRYVHIMRTARGVEYREEPRVRKGWTPARWRLVPGVDTTRGLG